MEYHQVEVHPDDREKTALSTPYGLFQYDVMPFGHATAPATFIRLTTIVFLGMLYNTCLAYLDDILLFLERLLRKCFNVLIKRSESWNEPTSSCVKTSVYSERSRSAF